ncbi:MAG: hypothetical protein ACYS0D_16000, partial [Planctomycetota bacterium]
MTDGSLGPRIADLQEQLKDSTQQLDCRVAEILAELGRAPVPVSGDAPPAANLQGALAGLEERITTALSKFPVAVASDGSGLAADLEDRLVALSDQLRVVDSRLAAIAPHLESLEQVPAGTGISADVIAETVGRLEERINEGMARSEQHFLEALAKLETSMAAGTAAPAAAPGATAPAQAATGTRDPKKIITALLAAVNSGDKQTIRRFVATEYAESALADRSVDDRIEVYLSFHEDAGELELRNIERSDD